MRTLILAALALLAGCASAPGTPETVAASTPPAAAAADTQSLASQQAESGEQKREFKPPAGYKTKIKDWDVVYCRKTTVLGSRFPKELCMTEVELKEYLASIDEMRRNKDQVSRICAQAAGCTSP